ncbi:unnamed protein product [Toxocara canis]|uniref:MOSC domain-containing protein n=1 Tax=Toxocara canis TaxID=6265 RepID=A0A183U6J4_TOXCA|nr:unnamed protein product [Toxocara canis]
MLGAASGTEAEIFGAAWIGRPPSERPVEVNLTGENFFRHRVEGGTNEKLEHILTHLPVEPTGRQLVL